MKGIIERYVADTETVVLEDTEHQQDTAVWASAYISLDDDSEDVTIDTSLNDTYYTLITRNKNMVIYYHNLKFDGNFWLNMLFELGYKFKHCTKISKHKMEKLQPYEFDTLVSEMGQMYWIRLCTPFGKLIELRDSLKLIPLALEEIGTSFKTKHRKLSMNYKGHTAPGQEITEEERKYIQNDVLVLKEALKFFTAEGHDKLTIGGCCMSEFKAMYDRFDYENMFPNLKLIRLHKKFFDEPDADEYCRKALRGGWTYLLDEKANKIFKNGKTFDVNSLYPSVMHSKSGNYYPVGEPHFFVGGIPEDAKVNNRVYFVKIQCDFDLKKGHLPTLQLKDDYHYDANEYLKTSKIRQKDNTYSNKILVDGKVTTYRPTFALTSVDFELFLKHYHVKNLKILSGCWYFTEIGLFDEYIDKYMQIKMTSKGGKRQLAKLFLNNLWGKFSTSDDSSYKEPYICSENGVLKWHMHVEHNKKVHYVALGCFVTAYARRFTITAAQANYKNFIYADTDSLHMTTSNPIGIRIHDFEMLSWKEEMSWKRAKFIRAKTYIEEGEDNTYTLKCAGMPEKCKEYFIKKSKDPVFYFRESLKVEGKLKPRQVRGGIVLVETPFTVKDSKRKILMY